ncbi:hypothetical protein B0T24DRAFT_661984 [Lasiosphaeria ovina]|uniref:N-acetyltransferase domain-containing protein n=1 Tax=Lasiosphaeria ovina TaxID=92902 RepID=A0AAE0NL28_9PEZI|nr:hypothetical protein B0T24DRAFT_661984 [Lasiosphaeria ovina]
MRFSVRAAQTGDVERLLEIFAAVFQDDEIVAYVALYRAQYPVAHRETMWRTVHGLVHDACSIAMVAEVAAGVAPADVGKVVGLCQLQLTSGRRIPVRRERTCARRHLEPFEVPLVSRPRALQLCLPSRIVPEDVSVYFGQLFPTTTKPTAAPLPADPTLARATRTDRLDLLLQEEKTALAELFNQQHLNRAWTLKLLATDPQYQGRGAGSLLVGVAGTVTDLSGVPLVVSTAENARGFYARLGFELAEPVGEVCMLIGGGDDKVTVRLDGEDDEVTFWTAKQRRRAAL